MKAKMFILLSIVFVTLFLLVFRNNDLKISIEDSEFDNYYQNCCILSCETDLYLIEKGFPTNEKYTTSIYKSEDDGKNWKLIYSIDDYRITSSKILQLGNCVYFAAIDTNQASHLIKFNIKSKEIKARKTAYPQGLNCIDGKFIYASNIGHIYIYDIDLNLIECKHMGTDCSHSYYRIGNRMYCLFDSCLSDFFTYKEYPSNIKYDKMVFSDTLKTIFLMGRNKNKVLEIDCFDVEKDKFIKSEIFKDFKFVDKMLVVSNNFICSLCKKEYNSAYYLLYSIDCGKTWDSYKIKSDIVYGMFCKNKSLYILTSNLFSGSYVYKITPNE